MCHAPEHRGGLFEMEETIGVDAHVLTGEWGELGPLVVCPVHDLDHPIFLKKDRDAFPFNF